MAYTKQNFSNGSVLTAENLNLIEDGIIANTPPQIVQTTGNSATAVMSQKVLTEIINGIYSRLAALEAGNAGDGGSGDSGGENDGKALIYVDPSRGVSANEIEREGITISLVDGYNYVEPGTYVITYTNDTDNTFKHIGVDGELIKEDLCANYTHTDIDLKAGEMLIFGYCNEYDDVDFNKAIICLCSNVPSAPSMERDYLHGVSLGYGYNYVDAGDYTFVGADTDCTFKHIRNDGSVVEDYCANYGTDSIRLEVGDQLIIGYCNQYDLDFSEGDSADYYLYIDGTFRDYFDTTINGVRYSSYEQNIPEKIPLKAGGSLVITEGEGNCLWYSTNNFHDLDDGVALEAYTTDYVITDSVSCDYYLW